MHTPSIKHFTVTIPTTAKERKEALIIRKKFASDSLSDHMVLLRAFQVSFIQKNSIV